MANRLKNEATEEASPKRERVKKSTKNAGFRARIQAIRNFLGDERTHKIFGMTLLLLAFFMVIAFVSNLFTWKEDQAIAGVNSIWELFTRGDISVENWLGKLGAVTALQFQNHWFGICAFFLPFLLTLAGVKILWDVALLPITKSLKYSLFTTIWL